MDLVNIFVLGLDDKNLETLRDEPNAGQYRFHRLLSRDELQYGGTTAVELLDRAQRQLEAFEGRIDAIVGYWDFPVSTMAPILQHRFGLRGATLGAVVKCEHKYWSRLEQRKVIDELPRFALLDVDGVGGGPVRPPEDLRYPVWIKPVKSYSSELAFRVEDEARLQDAVAAIREGAGRIGKPFCYFLDQLDDLPREITQASAQACLVEEELTGAQVTVEGFSRGGRAEVYGVTDSLVYPGTPCFLRYQYPSSLPPPTLRRLEDISCRVIEQIGLDNSTFCIEFFCDPETGDIGLLEVNPRHSQSHAMLFEQVDGIPNHHCMINLALGRDPHLPHRQGPYALAAKCYLRRFRDGRVLRRPGDEDIARVRREIPGVDVVPVVHEGDLLSEIPHAHDSYSYEIAHVFVAADSERELQEKYDRCVAALDFRFDDEDG